MMPRALLLALVVTMPAAAEPLFESRQLTPNGEYTFGIEGPAVDAAGSLYVVNHLRQGMIGKVGAGAARSELFAVLPQGSVGVSIRFGSDGRMFVADYRGHNVFMFEPGAAVLLMLSAELQGDDVRARIQMVEPLDQAAAKLSKGLRVFLRAEAPIKFFAEPMPPPEIDYPQGPGFWALTRYADVMQVSRDPEAFHSAPSTNIGDIPPDKKLTYDQIADYKLADEAVASLGGPVTINGCKD